MLQHLQILNLAIIENIEIEFSKNMTVITGETGAGKSILLDALELALGGRADSSMIRPGSENAQISATFNIARLNGALLWLADCDLTYEDSEQECVIRRILFANGRSRAYINDKIVTTSQLRLLGAHLVQMHGQHQHQLLLNSNEQRRLLDAFGQHDALLTPVKKAYENTRKLQAQKQALLGASQNSGQLELLRYQVDELLSLNITENEVEALNQTHHQLAHATEHVECCQNAISILQEDESSVIPQLYAIEKSLPTSIEDPNLSTAKACFKEASVLLEESLSALKHFQAQVDLDPEKLSDIEQRLEKLYDIARKHKIEPSFLTSHLQTLQKDLDVLENAELRLAALEEKMAEALTHFQAVAIPLSKARKKASKLLSQEINQHLQVLGMKGARLKAELIEEKAGVISPHGLENCQFLVSTNPDHPYQPLNKVVSGGELSRISLAIQLITAQYQESPTLVFDEVDVGVGGKIGSMIGQALRELGQSVQVLCVTHLPQVAACGHHHLLVEKAQEKGRTKTHLSHLKEKSRIEEIARMLGGMNISTQARANAKSLLKQDVLETV